MQENFNINAAKLIKMNYAIMIANQQALTTAYCIARNREKKLNKKIETKDI